jgi:endonuclease IV
MIFRRPELEKDNPMAPQPYVGPRRRLALARAAALKEFTEENDLKKALRDLTLAASHYVDRMSKTRKTEKSLKVLRDAIAQAERVMATEDVKGTRPFTGG